MFNELLRLNSGIPIIVTDSLRTGEYIQRRKHKKKRINKKWMKRYGWKPVYQMKAIYINGTIYVSPPFWEKMKRSIKCI